MASAAQPESEITTDLRLAADPPQLARRVHPMTWLKVHASAVRYRVGGLPGSIRYFRHRKIHSPKQILRHVEARRYWRVRSASEALELLIAILLSPVFVIGAAVWHTSRNAGIHARRTGRSAVRQFVDQLRIYVSSGVMPATYYIFSLVDHPTGARARTFLKRAETKGMLYGIVRQHMPPLSSLNDKLEFEKRCVETGLPTIRTIALVSGDKLFGGHGLPPTDLFIKPASGKGGRGAARWKSTGAGYVSACGRELTASGLLDHLRARSNRGDLLIQPCVRNHDSLADLNCGALATIRVLTCLNRLGEPEVIGAALRMAVDPSSVVDNLHQGGITAAIDLDTGVLGPASNLGKDARLGWLDRHPTTGAQIAGRRLEWWPQVSDLALRAQAVFSDRLFVGWDLAMTPDSPIIVEGNSSPDLDILQRSSGHGMANGRFAELLAERLVDWGEYERRAA